MTDVFLKIINMSISASWLVAAVLVFRLVFRKAPRWIHVLLWGIVAVRLLCPFSIESALSLIPSAETISPEIMMDAAPTIHTGIPAVNSVVNPVISEAFAPEPAASANPLQIWIPVLAIVWGIGVVLLLAYAAISCWRLRRRVGTAVLLRNNIFQSEAVSSPFVLGIVKPRIYLPLHMDGKDLEHVVSHEQAHLRRRDHWWKPLGFLLLTLHWFNPLMWLAYVLLCRDIELACDEKVIKELGNEQRADYSQALLACSVNRRMIAACPLAFGEVGVKERVKSVINYRKPAFWVIAVSVIACVVVAVCFLTNPEELTFDFEADPIEEVLTAYATDAADPYNREVRWPNQAQISELESRLTNLTGTKRVKDDDYAVTLASIEIELSSGEYLNVQSKDDGTLRLQYNEKNYHIENEEFHNYVLNLCSGGDTAAAPDKLTLSDVIALSQKGGELSWGDFERFSYIETGFGLYIRRYEIDETFFLAIGGAGPESEPMYIYLSTNTEPADRVDIRAEDVAVFISRHEEAAPVTWAYVPMMSATQHSAFHFSFDMDYSHIEASCDSGTLWDLDAKKQSGEKSLRFEAGARTCWRPLTGDSLEDTAEGATVSFTIYDGGEILYAGELVINQKDSADSGDSPAAVYEVRLAGTDLLALRQEDGNQGATVTLSDSAAIIAFSDLDHDGETENVVARELHPGMLYELAVEEQGGAKIWAAEASPAHTGWNTIMLYSEGGQDYLARYLPTMFQGVGSYTCTVFSLEGGKETVKEEWSVDFDLPVEETPEMARFAEEINILLRNSLVLLSTEQGILVNRPADASGLPQLYPVRFDPNEIQASIDGTAETWEPDPNAAQLPDAPLEFMFASGAGGWGTIMTLHPDGSFEGEYYDGEAFATSEHPRGMAYICQFSGRFGEMTRISDYAWSMRLQELAYDREIGKEWIEDQVLYVASDPHGLTDGEEFIFYAPGTPADELPAEFRDWWPDAYLWREGSVDTLSGYGLCNRNTGHGFFTSWLS